MVYFVFSLQAIHIVAHRQNIFPYLIEVDFLLIEANLQLMRLGIPFGEFYAGYIEGLFYAFFAHVAIAIHMQCSIGLGQQSVAEGGT